MTNSFFAILFNTDNSTSLRLSPFNVLSLIKRSGEVIGTSVGNNSVIEWPSDFAKVYPSPVEPVWGTLVPPVAIIKLLDL